MIVVQTAFSVAMTAIGVICTLICALFIYFAVFQPEQLEAAMPQITDTVGAIAQNAQALIKNLFNKIV